MSDLKEFRKANGVTQVEAARYLGCTQGFISQIEQGMRPVPEEFVKKILANPEWDGSMLTGSKPATAHSPKEEQSVISTGRVIPYYDAEVAAGTTYGMEMIQTAPSGMIEIGGLMKDSEFAMRVYGNSMVPNYPAGCVIGLRQYNEHFIEPGTVYVVETLENRFLKRLYYNRDKSAFRCLSDNHMRHENGPMEGEYYYPEFEIPFQDVKRLLRVTGVIKRNIL
ncbi:LexA family transcriptional regulator [Alistipes sp.]|uniref:LexA family transcriptional regulator n=1 Tax=Alistipes sp. TaxID=1872444 RepID=UPI003AEF700D